MTWLASLCLIGGALICVLAAIGLLRLPDFFMRMHAATKAGVVGSGLVLLSVALHDGSLSTWLKVCVAIAFLLLTTPVAGHLLGRAAYVGGAILWRGTAQDSLAGVLPRGHFGAMPATVRKVILALAAGPHLESAIAEAIALAQEHDAELCGVALIDVPRLERTGPAPAGAISYARRIRILRLAKARQAAADAIQCFESAVVDSGLNWSVRLEEGHPRRLLHALDGPATVLAVAPLAWFDHGVLGMRVDVVRRLRWQGKATLRILGT